MKRGWARTVCAASMLSTHPPTGRPRSSGANSGTSLVFAPMSRSAITAEFWWVAAASRYGI